MSLYDIKGDLLESNCNYICHQVNCQGRMGSGIAKSIREKWPRVYSDYMKQFEYMFPEDRNLLLGNIQCVFLHDEHYIVNMFAQEYYGYDGRRYTSYDAFWSCLGKLLDEVPEGSSIGFPKGIGCGLGGANWYVIRAMIKTALADKYEVYIYELEK